MLKKIKFRFIIICILPTFYFSQNINYKTKFDSVICDNYYTDYSIKRIMAKSKGGNAIHFFELSYFVNANTMVNNFAYNDQVIQNIINSADYENNSYKWIVTDVDSKSQNYIMKGKEFILYEGYLFRYIAEYLYKNPNSRISDRNIVKKTFFKWYNKSVKENGDASLLYGIRLHMGTHWATVASYLLKSDPENAKIYSDFIDMFNRQLRHNLKIVNINGESCYIWNSSYDEAFSNILKVRKKETVIQDVSHGNHIIQYVIDSYSLGYKYWTTTDLRCFSSTLKNIIWKNPEIPTDNVDGTFSPPSMGWKQSDGWMKLMNVNHDITLYNIYNSYYRKNANKIDKFYPNIQFYANMQVFLKNKIE